MARGHAEEHVPCEVRASAFLDLARAQRGRPEAMAVSLRRNPGLFNALGVFTCLAEHVGDLTHRMAEHGGVSGFGFAAVSEKVARGIRYSRDSREGLAENVERNLAANRACCLDDGLPVSGPEAFRAEFVRAAAAYADAHAALDVYNEAQWHGREAAVCLGRLDAVGMVAHLAALEERLLSGPDAWSEWAGSCEIRDGAAVPYTPGVPDPEENPAPGPRR